MIRYWWFLQNLIDPAGAERRSIERINRACDNLGAALVWYGLSAEAAQAALVRLLEDAKQRAEGSRIAK